MNSPPSSHFHYYNHNFHDPTLVNVHTLLNPQPFKHHTPPSIPTFQSATAQYWASHPPITTSTTNLFNHGLYQHYPYSSPTFTSSLTSPNSNYINPQYSTLRSEPDPPPLCFKQQPTQPLNSTTTTDFLLQQMLQSQQTLNHAISKLASDISTLNKSLTPLTHSQHITQHATNRAEPTSFNTTHIVNSVCEVEKEEKKRISDPVTKVIEEQTPTLISPPEVPLPLLVQSCNKIIPANELASEIQISVSEINKNEHPFVLVVDKGDFSLTVKSISQVGEEETKRVLNLEAISNPESGFIEEQKRDAIEVLKTFFSATTTPSTEMKVLCGVTMANTHSQHSRFFFNLSDFHIHIFDPGGITFTAFSAERRHSQIQKSSTFVFHDSDITFIFDPGGTFTVTTRSSAVCFPFEINKFRRVTVFFQSGSHHLHFHFFVATSPPPIFTLSFSLLWLLWDRGKFNVWSESRLQHECSSSPFVSQVISLFPVSGAVQLLDGHGALEPRVTDGSECGLCLFGYSVGLREIDGSGILMDSKPKWVIKSLKVESYWYRDQMFQVAFGYYCCHKFFFQWSGIEFTRMSIMSFSITTLRTRCLCKTNGM